MEPVNLAAVVSRLIGKASVFTPETLIADIHVLDGTPTTPGPLVFRGEHITDPAVIDQCRNAIASYVIGPLQGVMVESGDGYRVVRPSDGDAARLGNYIRTNRASIHGLPDAQ